MKAQSDLNCNKSTCPLEDSDLFGKKCLSERDVIYADHYSQWRQRTHLFGFFLVGVKLSLLHMRATSAWCISTFAAAGCLSAGRKHGKMEAKLVHSLKKNTIIGAAPEERKMKCKGHAKRKLWKCRQRSLDLQHRRKYILFFYYLQKIPVEERVDLEFATDHSLDWQDSWAAAHAASQSPASQCRDPNRVPANSHDIKRHGWR